MSKLPEIANCRCGEKAQTWRWYQILYSKWGYKVYCTRHACWIGPWRKTERVAINAWNKVMEKA